MSLFNAVKKEGAVFLTPLKRKVLREDSPASAGVECSMQNERIFAVSERAQAQAQALNVRASASASAARPAPSAGRRQSFRGDYPAIFPSFAWHQGCRLMVPGELRQFELFPRLTCVASKFGLFPRLPWQCLKSANKKGRPTSLSSQQGCSARSAHI